MGLTVKDQRKVVVVGWDTEGEGDTVIKGSHASMQVAGEEKRNVDNDGEANLYFPSEFEGEVDVTIKGSVSGEDTATLVVTATEAA